MEQKVRSGAIASKNWWESQGFLLGIVLLFGSLWGMNEGTATSIVTAVTGVIGAFAAVQQFFKTSKFAGWADWIRNDNTWVYLLAVVGQFLPNAGELLPALRGVTDAILSKNLGAILSALFTFGVMLWNIFFKSSAARK